MEKIIYEAILRDSPLAYFKCKAIKNNNDKYIDLIIKDTNDAFNRYYKNNKNIINKKISELLTKEDFNKINFENIIKTCNENKKYTAVDFNNTLDKYINCEWYALGDDNFLIRITEVSNDKMIFSDILRNSPFSVWIKGRDGRYIDVNRKFEEISNKSYHDIIGKNDEELCCTDRYNRYRKQDNEVMDTRKIQYYQDVIKLNENEDAKVYEITKWPYIDKDNNLLGTIGLSIELVNETSLRENLESNQKTFEEIVNYSQEVYIIVDREKALYISPSFKSLFGESPNKLYDNYKRIVDYYHPEDAKNFIIDFDKHIETIGRTKPIENEYKWLWSKGIPIKDERGNTIKKILVISDITKKKMLDLELESLRMDFFANISHELRTPINVIYGSLQVLQKMYENDSLFNIENTNKYLNIIDQNCLRLLRLVSNLIDSTKVDAGYLDYKPQNFDIINFVEGICMSVSEFAKQSNINLIFDTDTEEKVIAFDLDMMERIILNLISNAIKFNSDNGHIEVIITCDDYINIKVKDRGIGISKENLKSIFGRFEQVTSKKVHNREGSGIGLSLVKSLVDIHNGKIKADSKVGEGSTFTVSIPSIKLSHQQTIAYSNVENRDKVNRLNIEFSDIYL